MKKLILVALILSFSLLSCKRDDEGMTKVKFGANVSKQTKATVMDDTNFGSKGFGVFLFYDPADANPTNLTPMTMSINVYDNGSGWKSQHSVYWPPSSTDKMSFVGYAPCANANMKLSPITYKGYPYIDYLCDTATNVTNQVDLCYADPVLDKNRAEINFVFKHALAKVRFQGKKTGYDDTEIKIIGIAISGINSSGRISLKDGSWSDIKNPSTYAIDTNTSTLKNISLSSNLEQLNENDSYFMFIPQQIAPDAHFFIYYKEGSDAKVLDMLFSKTNITMLEQGKSYSININISKPGNTVYFQLSVAEWDDEFNLEADDIHK